MIKIQVLESRPSDVSGSTEDLILVEFWLGNFETLVWSTLTCVHLKPDPMSTITVWKNLGEMREGSEPPFNPSLHRIVEYSDELEKSLEDYIRKIMTQRGLSNIVTLIDSSFS